mmetsp:Transcript_19064/g.51844  ORF Transcript_19064/g.51844 Transcript_19064/m.51844 type:complete len:364 (-) Transcript_19064:77-1168(-)
MAHKSLKGRKKPRRSHGVRQTLKTSAKSRKTSREMKAGHKKKKAEELEKKAADLEAKKEAVLAATKVAEEEAAQKASEEAAKAGDPREKKGKKRKASEAAAAEAPAAAAEAPAAAAAPAEAEKPKRPLSNKDKRQLKIQASHERHHKALYTAGGRILCVGEGNFSFSRALCQHLGKGEGIFATSFDGDSLLKRKYADAAECRKEIEEKFGGTTLVGVDATRIHEVREFREAFRAVVWNFPHIGGGESDVEKSIGDHQRLLVSFFASAVKCLSEEEGASIHVSLKSREPYKSWKIKQMAKAACPDLELRSVVAFAPSAWPGYEHRRTVGFDARFSKRDSEELAAGAKVYVFTRGKAAAAGTAAD